MENKFLKIDNKTKYQDLLNKVLFKTFFHSLEWEDFLEKSFDWLKFERYLWQDQALLSLARVRILGQEKLISHPFCEYGGPLPLVEKVDGKAFSQDLLNQFKDVPFKISFHPQLLKYFEGIEFPENQRETFWFEDIDRKSASEIWQALDRNRHRLVEGTKNLIDTESKFQVIEWINGNQLSNQELKSLYNLYITNLKRHKALPYPYSFFKFISENSKIILLKEKEKIVGGNLFVPYGKIVHSFLCGFSKNYRKAHSFILWQAIIRSREEGFSIFDFGATKKDSSIKEFKERWGAKSYPIFELKNYTGDSKLKNSHLRDVWSHLPVGLIKVLSPYFIKYKL